VTLIAPALAAVVLLCPACSAESCEALGSSAIANTTLSAAMRAPAGALPAFCRVLAASKAAPDSEIHFEIWLPVAEAWNGKFLGTGNGGYSGALSYRQMEDALRRGYVTAGSDTGHSGADLAFGAGHPDKIDDWAWRAVHVMTETTRLVIRSYYGRPAAHSYFAGCSTGGQQALTEAQRFPGDYDGIVAGAPGINRVRLNVGFLWCWRVLHDSGDPLPVPKLPMLNHAVVAACDALDGLEDGVIADPRRCRFDPAALQCKGADDGSCLTPAQVSAVRKIYDGARNPRTGQQIFPGWPRGSEAAWGGYFVGLREPARIDFWRYWVFHNPNWDPHSFDFDKDVGTADGKMATVASYDPDLSAFQKRGGKLLMYHGWADPVVPPENSINYYESVRRTVGETAGFLRLFMVPGMSHCAGGPGPNTFDALGALDRWVEQGIAPEKIAASHSTNGKVDATRPLCPWPQQAHWNGSGRGDDAAQFVCGSD
jgi:feruloyl esterase